MKDIKNFVENQLISNETEAGQSIMAI